MYKPPGMVGNSTISHLFLGKNISEYFDLNCDYFWSQDSKIPLFEKLLAAFRGNDPNNVSSSLNFFTQYVSRNRFENLFLSREIISLVPLSSLKVAKIDNDTFLGIVTFSMSIINALHYNRDVNVFADNENRVVGYDSHFNDMAGKKRNLLGASLADIIDAKFITNKQGEWPLNLDKGTVVYDYTPSGRMEADYSNNAFFGKSESGLDCFTIKSIQPAFLKIPHKISLKATDFIADFEIENMRGEHPFIIVNGRDLNGPVFPDGGGLFFGQEPLTEKQGQDTDGSLSFIVKKMGILVSKFDIVDKEANRLPSRCTITLFKANTSLGFAYNGKLLYTHYIDDYAELDHEGFLIAGLRVGCSCTFGRITLKVAPSNPGKESAHYDTTRFHGKPEVSFKVNHHILKTWQKGGLLKTVHHYRLENLEEKELIRQLALKTQEQDRELKLLRSITGNYSAVGRLVGNSKKSDDLRKTIAIASKSNLSIHITGETGTGKTMIAGIIHENSGRRDKPFVKVDCATIPETLIESELFGYEKGAFTGAFSSSIGKFELADGGTIFLDEIGNISLGVQAKLLSVLQDRTIMRIGGKVPVPINVRLLSASNRKLEELVRKGEFRSDLYYRLNALVLSVPPLRNRLEDIPLLCEDFLEKEVKASLPHIKSISPRLYKKLIQYDWPGNVRELFNLLQKSAVLCEKDVLDADDVELPVSIEETFQESRKVVTERRHNRQVSTRKILEELEKCEGNISWAAERLGISRLTIYNKIKKSGMDINTVRDAD